MGFSFKVLSCLVLALSVVSTSAAEAVRCKHPSKRQEWRTLSAHQKADWLRAIKCLSKLPHTNALAPLVKPSDIPPVNTSSSYWDDIVYIHMDLNTRIHNTGHFFPWHRWYVHHIESELKSKCGYKGVAPYWDWTKDSSDFYGATIFQESDPVSGLGGWGNPAKDYAVPDGALSDLHLSYPSPHTLRRNFTLQPYLAFKNTGFPLVPNPEIYANDTFRPQDVQRVITGYEGDFKAMQHDVEGFASMHGSVHVIMGGDLGGVCPSDAPAGCQGGPTFSANEPMFQLHHAMVDKIWFDWQQHKAANKFAFEGGSIQPNFGNLTEYNTYPNGKAPFLGFNSPIPTDGLFGQATIGDVVDTTGGYLCYVYV
jgi:tyrosinase